MRGSMRLPFFVVMTAAILTALTQTPATAGTIYSTEASFQAALGSYYEETYTGFLGTTTPQTFSSNGFSYNTSTPGGFFTSPKNFDGTNGSALMSFSANQAININTFNNGGVNGIGGYFFTTDGSGTVQDGSIMLTFSDGFSTTISSTFGSSGQYLGYIPDSHVLLTSLVVGASSGTSRFSVIDNLTVGNLGALQAADVPEIDAGSAAGVLFALYAGAVMLNRRSMRATA